MNKYKKLMTDTVLFTISNFASKALVFLMLPLYTNILSTEEYAIADLITTTINLILPILTLSISEAVLRFAFEKDISKDEIISTASLFLVLSTLLLVIVKPIIARFSLASTLDEYWWYFVVCYFSIGLQGNFSCFARGCNKTKVFAISGIVHTITIIASNILCLVVFKLGLTGYLFSMVLSYIVTACYIIVKGPFIHHVLHFRLNKIVIKQMLKYSIPMISTIIAWWFMQTSDKYMVIWKLGLSESGIYSVSYKIPSILTIVSSLFTQAWQISAISNYGEKDNASFVGTVYKYFHMVSILACAFLIFSSKLLGGILYAKDYFIAWKCVPILLIAYVFSGLSGFLASIFTASKKTNYLFMSTSVGAILNILLNLVFIDWLGILGAAFTTLIGFFVTWIIRLKISRKILKIDVPLVKHISLYLILLIDAIYMYNEFPYMYMVSGSLFAIITVINLEEIKFILKRGKQFLLSRKHKIS